MRFRKWTWLATGMICGALAVRGGAAANPGGTVVGTVRLVGRPPALAAYPVEHDFEVCGEQARLAQSLVLGTNQAVGQVIVYLGAPPQPLAGSLAPVTLDQQHCDLIPRIQVARRGAPLLVQNSDPLLHVLRFETLGGTNGVTVLHRLATPYAGFEKSCDWLEFPAPTVLKVTGENGQEWMTAYIAVLPHPWAALTDANGHYRLSAVPPGRYKLYAWHEVLGTLAADVAVAGNRPVVADLQFRGVN